MSCKDAFRRTSRSWCPSTLAGRTGFSRFHPGKCLVLDYVSGDPPSRANHESLQGGYSPEQLLGIVMACDGPCRSHQPAVSFSPEFPACRWREVRPILQSAPRGGAPDSCSQL